MRGAQFSATLNIEKCSDSEGQTSTSYPCEGGFALVLATLSYTAFLEEITSGVEKPQSL